MDATTDEWLMSALGPSKAKRKLVLKNPSVIILCEERVLRDARHKDYWSVTKCDYAVPRMKDSHVKSWGMVL